MDRRARARVGQPYDVLIESSGNETAAFMNSVQNGPLPAGLEIERWAAAMFVACSGTNVSAQTGTKAHTLVVRQASSA